MNVYLKTCLYTLNVNMCLLINKLYQAIKDLTLDRAGVKSLYHVDLGHKAVRLHDNSSYLKDILGENIYFTKIIIV